MIKAILVDDEKRSRDSLQKLLENYCEGIEVIFKAESVDNAILAIDKYQPDVVFLDIQMPGKNGFALLEHYKNPSFKVVFTTAFNEYAIKAIKWAALDYLLKPIDIDELQSAVAKIPTSEVITTDQHVILQAVNDGKEVDKFVIKMNTGFKIIKLKEVIRIEASGNYCEIFLLNGKRLLSSKTIKDYDDLLSESGYFRLHRSHLVNIDFVDEFKKGRSGIVIMKDGKEIAISRERKTAFLKLFG